MLRFGKLLISEGASRAWSFDEGQGDPLTSTTGPVKISRGVFPTWSVLLRLI